MKFRPNRAGAGARHQSGFALILVLSLAALISGYLMSTALKRTGADLVNEREQRSMHALRQAKAALIAYAASEQWQAYKAQTTTQPGGLPCPDVNNTGTSPGICSGAANRVGRLPWITIGSEDLRDASGERLWYAVSSNLYKNAANSVNSDTQGLLTVGGTTAPASNAAAIVFASGEPINGQNRSGGGVNSVAAYLEGFTNTSPDYTFTANALPTGTFNDRLLVITQAELMATVEPVVAARIERDIKPYIQNYFTAWGIYPFAAPFAAGGPPANPGRAQSEYKGSTGQDNGLLPLTTDPSFAGWQTSSISVTQIPGGTGSSTVTAVNCTSSTSSQVVCRIDYSGGSGDRVAIQLQATLLNVARSFLRPVVQSDKSMTDGNGNPTDWSGSSPAFTPTLSNTLLGSGSATVVFTGRLRSASSTNNRVTITVPASYYPITNAADATAGWFVANQWYRQTYYAVAPDLLLGGVFVDCVVNTCLTVNKLRPSYPISNDKQAILVFAGRALNGSARPSGNLNDYFESQNSTPADFIYENRSGVPTSINDRVVVVAP